MQPGSSVRAKRKRDHHRKTQERKKVAKKQWKAKSFEASSNTCIELLPYSDYLSALSLGLGASIADAVKSKLKLDAYCVESTDLALHCTCLIKCLDEISSKFIPTLLTQRLK